MDAKPKMIEVFSGKGRIASAFRRLGWETLTVDMFARADIQADARHFNPSYADFVWASPPCDEFSASSLPWHPKFRTVPSVELANEARRIINASRCLFYGIENVKGSVPHIAPLMGFKPQSFGPIRLWHNLPRPIVATVKPWKQSLTSSRKADRAAMPITFANAVARAVDAAVKELRSRPRVCPRCCRCLVEARLCLPRAAMCEGCQYIARAN